MTCAVSSSAEYAVDADHIQTVLTAVVWSIDMWPLKTLSLLCVRHLLI